MRIWIGSLSYEALAADIFAAFEAVGFALTDVHVMTDRLTGNSKGFAFAECDDHRVIEHMNNTDICGRRIVVNEAKPRPQKDRPWKGSPREQDHRHGRQD